MRGQELLTVEFGPVGSAFIILRFTTCQAQERLVVLPGVRNGQIASLQCFFGGNKTYPSSVSKG